MRAHKSITGREGGAGKQGRSQVLEEETYFSYTLVYVLIAVGDFSLKVYF